MSENLTKYKPWGKKVYRRDIDRVVEIRKWLGPRGKQLTGTGKALARLIWDRKRAGQSLKTPAQSQPGQSQKPKFNLRAALAAFMANPFNAA